MKKEDKVCFCFNVTVADIENAVNKGADSVESVKAMTNASKGCGRCSAKVEEVFNELSK